MTLAMKMITMTINVNDARYDGNHDYKAGDYHDGDDDAIHNDNYNDYDDFDDYHHDNDDNYDDYDGYDDYHHGNDDNFGSDYDNYDVFGPAGGVHSHQVQEVLGTYKTTHTMIGT